MNKLHNLTKTELLIEIDICLERNGISQKDFAILHSLKYLLQNGYFPLIAEIKFRNKIHQNTTTKIFFLILTGLILIIFAIFLRLMFAIKLK